jgi:hypothetical protein
MKNLISNLEGKRWDVQLFFVRLMFCSTLIMFDKKDKLFLDTFLIHKKLNKTLIGHNLETGFSSINVLFDQ